MNHRSLSCASALLICSTLAAQNWTRLSPSASPPARNNHVMCTDTARNVVVMFGGLNFTDTWEFDGTTWTQKTPATSPPALGYAGMTYDSARKVCVLFGGRVAGTRQNDTWEWDGTNWKLINTTNRPAIRYGHAQCYDSFRRVTVVFSGYNTTPYYPDTWEYDGTDWKQVATTGPIGRIYPHMAFDFVRGKCVLFSGYSAGAAGGPDMQDTWEWDGRAWTQVPLSCQPLGRWGHSMTYVLGRGIVMFGGRKQSGTGAGIKGDTWVYNGTWAEIKPTTSPSARYLHTMSLAPRTQKPLLFGGTAGGAETHEFDIGAFVAGQYEAYGNSCAGTAGSPTLGAAGACTAPYINETFNIELTGVPAGSTPLLIFGLSRTTWNGANLPMDWSFMGFTGCSLHTSIVITLPMTVAGNAASLSVPVPNQTPLVGFSFYNQAFVPDAAANPARATLSNGVAATIGRR